MSDYNFREVEKKLSSALIDDFRGFLVGGTKRLEVPDDNLHIQVAFEEMLKVPGWEYVSGTGQNPIVEFMKEKRAIYITKIPTNAEKTEFCRTVGYLKESFQNKANFRGQEISEYLMLRKIALGMGYDVDEYELLEIKEGQKGTPVSIVNYKGDMKVKESPRFNISQQRSVMEGDEPVFDSLNNLIGFKRNGKFIDAHHYERYANINHNSNINQAESKGSNEEITNIDDDFEL